MISTKLDREAIQDLTDRLLSARNSNLKKVLEIDHRLELVENVRGVEFLNDSKSTTVNATRYSLNCLEGPIIWLVSCMEHLQDLSELRGLVEQKVSAIFYLGNENPDLVEEFVQQVDVIQSCDTMVELVAEAMKLAEAGDTVLYSPASASSDQFGDYRSRGEAFRSAVRTIEH